MEDVAWANIVVGDVVFLRDGDSVPADMILLSSVEKTGIAHVDTATLDGETNLKQLTSVQVCVFDWEGRGPTDWGKVEER